MKTEIMDVTANIQARREAEEIIEFIGEKPARFWELIAKHAANQLPPAPQAVDQYPPMTEAEAIRFESLTAPYGKHAGEEIGTIDPSYLLFLTEGDEFSKKLRRYVKSKRFYDRQ